MKLISLAFIFLLARSASAQSPYFGEGLGDTGNILVEDCKAPDRASMCLEYVVGVLDGWTLALDTSHRTNKICVPENATAGQLQKVVIKYGDNHPEELHFKASEFVLVALGSAFPCSK